MKITATIQKNGDSTIKVEGVKGRKCQDITADLVRDLGAVVSEEKTAEFYEKEKTNRVHLRERG